jgi:hypothetical protein
MLVPATPPAASVRVGEVKVQVESAGSPEQLSVTDPAKLCIEVAVIA